MKPIVYNRLRLCVSKIYLLFGVIFFLMAVLTTEIKLKDLLFSAVKNPLLTAGLATTLLAVLLYHLLKESESSYFIVLFLLIVSLLLLFTALFIVLFSRPAEKVFGSAEGLSSILLATFFISLNFIYGSFIPPFKHQ